LKKFFFLFILFCFAFRFLDAQEAQQDSVSISDTSTDTSVIKHSPRKAVIMSALVPGLGQVYNQKYWKVPMVYAALGTLTYFIIDYNKKYQKYVNAYKDFTDNDPETNSFENINKLKDWTGDKKYLLKSYRDFYRRWRDLDVLIIAGVYVLNIIDANVDAHFFDFEIDDDLSLNVKPVIFKPLNHSCLGVSLSLNF
jgi:hypothetical protein